MPGKQLPLIEEMPLIAAGFIVVTVGALAATVVLRTTQLALHLSGLDRQRRRARSSA